MRRPAFVLSLIVTLVIVAAGGRPAAAQPSLPTLTAGQQVLSRYLLASGTIPANLQIADITPLDNVTVAAFAQTPADIQKIINRARLDGVEQDFTQTDGSTAQIQLQLSLFRDAGGAVADVGDPSLLAGLGATTIEAPAFGDVSAGYATSGGVESTNLVFAAGRIEILISEVGRAGSTKQSDILPLARIMESRSKLPAPPPSQVELAVLQTQTTPEAILHDAYSLLLENYLQKLPPSQLLGAAYGGAIKALTDAQVTGLPAAPNISSSDEDQAWSQFLPAFQQLEKLVPSSISTRDLAYDAATEMYNNLNCHTSFFTPSDYAREVADLKGSEQARIGITIEKFPAAGYVILRVEQNSPAEQAGLRAGDAIQAVNHQTTDELGDHFTDQLHGAAGAPLTLTIQRVDQAQAFDVTVIRQNILPTNVQHRILPGGIGYVELDDFTDGPQAVNDIKQSLQDFQSAGNVNSWILDLRYNSGGSEQTLQQIAGLFLSQGSPIASETEQDGTLSQVRAAGMPVPNQKSMVLLIGQDTASAAEIFAQAMKSLGRVTLVGETTAGCVNGGLPLGLLDGSGIFVSTIDVRAGPDRIALENSGLAPDVSVAMRLQDLESGRDPQLDAAVALFGGSAPAPQPASRAPLRLPSALSGAGLVPAIR
ncbi:MAG TPA: S41 family peptidase [Dehalococcoidia bacterium]|nr:S41 family peptidase [Dehalococcoidia bacterium]